MIVLLAAAIMYQLEHSVNPDEFRTVPAAIYWSISTITAVGYGDATPRTNGGKFVTCCLQALVGHRRSLRTSVWWHGG